MRYSQREGNNSDERIRGTMECPRCGNEMIFHMHHHEVEYAQHDIETAFWLCPVCIQVLSANVLWTAL